MADRSRERGRKLSASAQPRAMAMHLGQLAGNERCAGSWSLIATKQAKSYRQALELQPDR